MSILQFYGLKKERKKKKKVRATEEAGWVVDVTLYIMGMQKTRLRSSFLVDPIGKLILRKQVRWSRTAPPAWGTLRAVSLSQTLPEVAMLHVNLSSAPIRASFY